ncbi:hypothetical protein E2C01_084994 [Portunus trituberculatus]|uniref:Uncharacterized protein n=1 Tax=Portunus trituberculatus TaxID=210409 RepID=A0A5B7J995_PORTR|nr:hypothetical protein [Portunus trituberculatus]
MSAAHHSTPSSILHLSIPVLATLPLPAIPPIAHLSLPRPHSHHLPSMAAPYRAIRHAPEGDEGTTTISSHFASLHPYLGASSRRDNGR